MRAKLFLAVLATTVLSRQVIPPQASQYKARLTREAHAAGGLGAPTALFAGQLHQESGYNVNAHSGVGAVGIAQFMPGSAAWVARVYPVQLGGPAPLDPAWAIRALVYYDYWNYQRLPMFDDAQENRWAASLAAYNGGLGWIQKDARIGTCKVWWGCAENVEDGRTQANLQQNREYPRKIILLWEPMYKAAGW